MRRVSVIELATLAAVIEFLCLRLLLRMGPLLPQTDILAAIGNGLAFIGMTALNVGLLLMIIALVEHVRLIKSPLWQSLILGCVVLTIVLFLIPNGSMLYSVWLVCVWGVMAEAWRVTMGSLAYRVWLGLVLIVYFLVGYATLAPGLQINLIARPLVLALAELSAVLVAISAILVMPIHWDWRAMIVSVIGGIILGGMWLGAAWLPPTIMIWIFALTGYLYFPVYVLAFAVFLYTLATFALRSETRYLAIGLGLIALGGLRWDYPYYVLLALIGVIMLAQNAPLTLRPLTSVAQRC